jgi:hypothetical protein
MRAQKRIVAMNGFIPLKVSSGLEVEIRPRTYGEWEEQEEMRLKYYEHLPELAKTGRVSEAELIMQRGGLVVRNARLGVWVKNFADVKSKLTLRDIAEIEKAAVALESVEIQEGNLSTGGNGQ